MMFYDVLCLKSILGFLLSEHTSGVSPVIFLYKKEASTFDNFLNHTSRFNVQCNGKLFRDIFCQLKKSILYVTGTVCRWN